MTVMERQTLESVRAKKPKNFQGNSYCYSVAPDDGESLISGDVGPAHSRSLAPPTSRAAVFNEKLVEVYQPPLRPSSTPHSLPHHFLTYNMVGVVRSHSDDDTPMIEVGAI